MYIIFTQLFLKNIASKGGIQNVYSQPRDTSKPRIYNKYSDKRIEESEPQEEYDSDGFKITHTKPIKKPRQHYSDRPRKYEHKYGKHEKTETNISKPVTTKPKEEDKPVVFVKLINLGNKS